METFSLCDCLFLAVFALGIKMVNSHRTTDLNSLTAHCHFWFYVYIKLTTLVKIMEP